MVKSFNAQTGSFNEDLKEYVDATFTPGAAVANSATAPSAGYVQAEAVAVITKLNALLTSLRAAGIIAT